MKVLITGGAGFIGSHLCDALLTDGNEVIVVDDLSLGKLSNIAHLKNDKNFKFYKEDILNMPAMNAIFDKEKFEMVFHLAANSEIDKSMADPSIDFNKTFMTTYNVLNLMKNHGVKKLMFASTSAIYGDTNRPISEDYGPLFPISLYGSAKLASEAFISGYCENFGIKAWIARFPNVIGERATHGVVYNFVRFLKEDPDELTILADGKQNKPYLYVKDLVEAILLICKKTDGKINYFNIGVDGGNTSVNEIAAMTIEEMGLKAKIKHAGGERGWVGDVREYKFDLTKIHKLGWFAKNTSNEAVKKAIKLIVKESEK
jgi:UDP-glucose 4-epimerase